MGKRPPKQLVAWSAANNAYLGFVRFPNGRRRKAQDVDPDKAQAKLDELITLRNRELDPERRDHGATFDDVITAWLNAGCPNAPGPPLPGHQRKKHASVKIDTTVAKTVDRMRVHVVPRRDLDTPKQTKARRREPNQYAVTHLAIDRTQPKRIAQIFDQMDTEGLATDYIDKTWGDLNAALQWGIYTQRNRTNPAAEILLPAKRPAKVTRNLQMDEAIALFAVIPLVELAAMWLTALMLGLRPGEVLGLRWCYLDLDSEKPTADIVEAAIEINSKYVRQGPVKTDREARLELHPLLVTLLKQHRETMIALDLYDDCDGKFAPHGFVFCTMEGTARLQSNHRRSFTNLIKKTELPISPDLGKFVPYSLRHSFASIADEVLNENQRRNIGRVMGHTRRGENGVHTRTTAGYIHGVKPTIDTTVEVWDAFLLQIEETEGEALEAS